MVDNKQVKTIPLPQICHLNEIRCSSFICSLDYLLLLFGNCPSGGYTLFLDLPLVDYHWGIYSQDGPPWEVMPRVRSLPLFCKVKGAFVMGRWKAELADHKWNLIWTTFRKESIWKLKIWKLFLWKTSEFVYHLCHISYGITEKQVLRSKGNSDGGESGIQTCG